jgi:hypothetical protein
MSDMENGAFQSWGTASRSKKETRPAPPISERRLPDYSNSEDSCCACDALPFSRNNYFL